MGDFIVNITEVANLGIDIITIADSGDEKSIQKFIPKILKTLNDHSEIFKNFDGNISKFHVLDLEVTQLIKKEKNLQNTNPNSSSLLLSNQSGILSSIVDHLPDLEKDQQNKYEKEREFLEDLLKNNVNLFKKVEILNSIDIISHKMKDKTAIEKIQGRRKKILSELKKTKERMKYFLERTKESISNSIEHSKGKPLFDVDLKDAYLNLYSFSSKLKLIGKDDICSECREIAKILIDKPFDQEHNFPNLISNILSLSDDIDFYFK